MPPDTPKLKGSGEPFSSPTSDGGPPTEPTSESHVSGPKQRSSCCRTLLQAAKVCHPDCVDWHLKQRDCVPKLLRHQHARVQRPLHEAAKATPASDGHETPQCTLCVEKLLGAGLDMSWLDENGRSALERAAMVGCVPCIEALLRSPTRASTEAVCAQRSAALVEAARIDSETSVRALLGLAFASVAQVGGETSELRLGPALIEAVKGGAYDCITLLVEAGATPNARGDVSDDGSPALLLAAAGRKGTTHKQKDDRAPDMIRLLVKLGAEVNTQDSSSGRSALHVASLNGRCDCMQALLELGADPLASDVSGRSPLHLAASARTDACRLLVKHIAEASGDPAAAAALLAQDNWGSSPLRSALFREHSVESASCMSVLLDMLKASGGPQAVAGALREKTGHKGRTIVHSAAENRHVDALKALMEEPEGLKVALEFEDNDGTTAIALARQKGHDSDDVPAFAQVPFVPCCSGLVEATEKGHVACVKYFLLKHAWPAAEGPRMVGGEDLDPLSSSISHRGHTCSKIVQLLLEAGFHPDGRHGDFVPLQNATAGGDVCAECSRLLIEAGAGGLLLRWNKYGDSAMENILYHASGCCGDESMPLVKAALAACDIKEDRHGVTHLCRWAGRSNLELPKWLADAGVDVKAENRLGQTVLHMATGLPDFYFEQDYEGEEDFLRDSDEHAELVGWLVAKVGGQF